MEAEIWPLEKDRKSPGDTFCWHSPEEERALLYFNCVLPFTHVLCSDDFSTECHDLVYDLGLWLFLITLTQFLMSFSESQLRC